MVTGIGSTPRRARYLIPEGTPRRREVVAAYAVAILVAHLLLAQLTLVLAVIFVAVNKASRWRAWWLLAPAAVGLAWTLAAGPGSALAGFTAGPSSILWHLEGGHLAGRAASPLAGFGGVASWLPRQLPVALIAGAAEAALTGWLDWLHTDEWAVPPRRPGLVAAARRAVAARAVRSGGVVSREGVALGMVSATGARAELRWAEAVHGTLIVGAVAQDVTLAGLQVVHAALRLRKPVIVIDPGDAAIARALDTACAATGVPLLAIGASTGGRAANAASAGGVPAPVAGEPGEQVAGGLGRAVRERSAVLITAGTAELASRACAELVSLTAELRRIGVDGDALVWVPHGETVPAQALAGLLRGGPGAGLAVTVGTTSPATATELRGLTGSALIYRVADPDLAVGLVMLAGTRLLPRSLATRAAVPMTGVPMAPGPMAGVPMAGIPMAGVPMAGTPMAGAPMSGVPMAPGPMTAGSAARAAASVDAADLVPGPVIPVRALLELGRAEFILAVSRPRPRVIAAGRMVPARLPSATERRPGLRGGNGTRVVRELRADAGTGLRTGVDGGLRAGGDAGLRAGDGTKGGAGFGRGDRTGLSGETRAGAGPGHRPGYRTGRPGAPS
jgi:hypothetical protein